MSTKLISSPFTVEEIETLNQLHLAVRKQANCALKDAISLGANLFRAKQKVKPGEWSLCFESAKFTFSKRWSENYINIFLNRDKLIGEGLFSIASAKRFLVEDRKKSEVVDNQGSDANCSSQPRVDNQPLTTKSTIPNGDSKSPVESGKSQKRETPKQDDKTTPKPPAKRPIELDEIGTPIPEDAIPFWHRKQEIQDLLTQISHIKKTIERHRNESDPMFAKVSNGAVDQLSLVYQQVLEAKPYAVCTTCMGRFSVQPKGCSFCGNKGLISKWQWDTQSRKEVKDMRIKANTARAAA